MDIYDVRRRNLKQLIAQYDGPTALAKKLQHKGTSYISQLSNARRPITERTAREIERQLRLPALWFDTGGEKSIAPAAPVPVDLGLFEEAVRRVVAQLEKEGRKLPPSKFARAVSYVYQEAGRGVDVDVASLLRLTE